MSPTPNWTIRDELDWIGLLSVASTTRVILSHVFPESIGFDWTLLPPPVLPHRIARGESGSPPPSPSSRIGARLLRLASLVLDDGLGSGRVSIYAGNAVGKNLIPILKAFGLCLPLTRA